MDISFKNSNIKSRKKIEWAQERLLFSFKMGKIIACLYIDGNDSLKRKNNEAGERGEAVKQ